MQFVIVPFQIYKIRSRYISQIINEYREFENGNSGSELLKDASLSKIYKYMFGITNEQFLFFNMGWVIQSFNRNFHILKKTRTQIEGKGINIDEITIEKFGLQAMNLFR